MLFRSIIKFKKGKDNVVADSLSRRHDLLTHLDSRVLGFTYIQELYKHCRDEGPKDKYYLFEGFLFRVDKVCIPRCSLRLLLIEEAHNGGLQAYFGRDKTYAMLSTHFH